MFGEFEDKWDVAYLFISWSWRRIWPRIAPFFAYPPEIWKVIFTTNAFELVLMSLRKITKNGGSYPSDGVLMKQFYLALCNISQKRPMPIRDWTAALPDLRSSSRLDEQPLIQTPVTQNSGHGLFAR